MWIFKTDAFKLVLALAILGVIVGLMFYAQMQAEKEEKAHAEMTKAHPTADKISIDNYNLSEVDGENKVKWKLTAKSGVFEKDNNVHLTDIVMQYFDGDQIKMQVSAPIGVANENSREVKLDSTSKQPVVAEGEQGKSRMETKRLELTKKNGFKATGGVNIVVAGVAKVTGDMASGVLGKADLDGFKITGHTHAIIE